jgi:hypothetical protein
MPDLIPVSSVWLGMGDDDEPIALQLDRESAENLMSVLTIFLLKGEGEDASNSTAPSEH